MCAFTENWYVLVCALYCTYVSVLVCGDVFPCFLVGRDAPPASSRCRPPAPSHRCAVRPAATLPTNKQQQRIKDSLVAAVSAQGPAPKDCGC